MPLSFIGSRISFSWQVYLWGCDRGYIKNTDILDIAIEKLAKGAEDPEILDLAVIGIRIYTRPWKSLKVWPTNAYSRRKVILEENGCI